MKILIVDDSKTARLMLRSVLEPQGHQIMEAGDGAMAITVLDSQPDNALIDLMLLDWNMPVMTGIDCLTELRRNPRNKGVKVVMCTTESEKASIMKAIQAGANGYLLKPFTPEVVLQQVRKALGLAAVK